MSSWLTDTCILINISLSKQKLRSEVKIFTQYLIKNFIIG